MNAEEENRLARIVQEGFPVTERPYQSLADTMNVSESEILRIMEDWRDSGRLREISAVMEGDRIGYESALVCGAVPASKVEQVASVISEHPLVTHNYERRHFYNIWFTIAAPEHEGIESHIESLERLTGVRPFHVLRRRHTFKIGVVFDLIDRCNRTVGHPLTFSQELLEPDAKQQRIIRAIQSNLPLASRPFKSLSAEHGLAEGDLLEFLTSQKGKSVRKYVATFHHRRLGVKSNAMTCWQVDESRITDVGALMLTDTAVSHCYSRDVAPGFPYNLYTMLHGPDMTFVGDSAQRLSELSGCNKYIMLESTREFKKTRLRYFTEAEMAWRERHLERVPA